MSKLESLTQKILEDAQAKADSMLAEADKKSKGLLNARVREAQDRKEKIIEKATSEAVMAKDRVVSSAELKVRDEKLSAKQEILERVFEMARNRLDEIDDSQYVAILEKALKDINLKGSGTLVVPTARKALAEGVVKNLPVTADDSMGSGFMIKDDDILYNYTFESLIDELRDQVEGDIAVELFKELE
jgi:V/A-type H+-transporting ATPase subunit E